MELNQLTFRPTGTSFVNAQRYIKLMDQTGGPPSNTTVTIVSKLAKNIKTVKAPVSRYFEASSQLVEPEYDLISVFKLLKHEPYFLKSSQKKLGLLSKSGFSVQSDNDKVKEYMDARFAFMFMQTGKSLTQIVNQLAYYMIVCSNAFVIKVRDRKFPHASSYRKDSKEMHPVVGFFTAHPVSMRPRFKMIKNGRNNQLVIDKWIHSNMRGQQVEFHPDDVVHFTLLKEDGMIFGMPEVYPVIDDIRTLRKIEEDVQLLIYRDLFPIIHYKVENPTMIDHSSGVSELDRARMDMERVIQDGGIATDKRHEIEFIGSDGKGIDAKPYLDYFQQRVFTGLGVSKADMGVGEDISGATAASMSKQLTDAVKQIQQELAKQFNEQIMYELSLQSPFGMEIFKEGVTPRLEFNEADIEWKIRQENHEADLFTKNVKTIDEVRNKLGLNELTDEELARTYQGLIGQAEVDQQTEANEHMAKVNASAQPKQMKTASGGTKLVGGAKEPGTWNNKTSTGVGGSAADRDSVKSAKSNSNIVKSPRLKDSISIQDDFKRQMGVVFAQEDGPKKKLGISMVVKLAYDQIKADMRDAYIYGAQSAYIDMNKLADKIIIENVVATTFENVDKLRDDVIARLKKDPDYVGRAAARIGAASKTEMIRAYNYGYGLTCVENGIQDFIVYTDQETVSEDTAKYLGDHVQITDTAIVSELPPFRPNSRLKIKLVDLQDSTPEEKVEEEPKVVIQDDSLKKDDILKLVTDRAGVEMQMLDALRASLDSRMSDEETKEYNDRFEKLAQAITDLKAKDIDSDAAIQKIADSVARNMIEIENTLLEKLEEREAALSEREASSQSTIKVIADAIRESSERNLEMFRAAIESLPKSIEVNTPPMEINLTVDDKPVPQKPGKKKMQVIRDEKGNIISAEIVEEEEDNG